MLIKKVDEKREEEKCDRDRKIERKSGGRKRAIEKEKKVRETI